MIEIDWNAFTPYTSLLGGVMIGASAVTLIVTTGRIAGISGILGGLIRSPVAGDMAWRMSFVIGLLIAPWLYMFVWGPLPYQNPRNNFALIAAGLLVGYGTRLASGCTSGHGVCGLSRLSFRSLVATLTFMTMGFITASFVMKPF